MSTKVLHILYNDDDILMDAVKATRAAHHHIEEVYTPFPVHGLDKAMGLKPTRLAICSFIYGLCGLSFATFMMNYIMIQDWPQDIGGKPSFSYIQNMPSFVPIMFEMTVFFARSEEHTSELQSRPHLVCRLLLEKKKNNNNMNYIL